MTTADTAHTTAGNLRAELGRQKRKKSELALLLGISPAAVTRRVSGETPLDVNELCAIAAWLDVPVTALLPSQPTGTGTTAQYLTDSWGLGVLAGAA